MPMWRQILRGLLYRVCDLFVATPLRDAATLPALEFVVAARREAALVLSEFSGTAQMLPDAFIVNPHDCDAVSAAVAGAISSTPDDMARRMDGMRAHSRSHDHQSWAMQFLTSLHSDILQAEGSRSAH
jgi:trehalose-6-phosphate synthase